jgi:polysaccharide export outer membrane protein
MEKMRYFLVVFSIALLLSGCGSIPSSGPWNTDIQKSKNLVVLQPSVPETHEADALKVTLVKLTPAITNVISNLPYPEDADEWPDVGIPSNSAININDRVQVTIYESQAGGLFVPREAGARPGNYVSIPAQEVGQSGTINIPYAGEVRVVGKTPTVIAKEIVERLSSRAIEPQVVVSVVSRLGSEVSVLGAVRNASNFALSLDGDRVLDAIARAGGPLYPDYESWVTLHRDGRRYVTRLDRIVRDSSRDIFLKPSDTLFISRDPDSFQVFGAAGLSGFHNFEDSDISLAEALGRAKGLRDDLANPAGIFVYRRENLRYTTDASSNSITIHPSSDTESHIYQINLRDPKGFFLAQSFQMKNKDIIYITNSDTVDLRKFLDFITATSVTKSTTQSAIEQ